MHFQDKEIHMRHDLWNDYAGWAWLLCCAVSILVFRARETGVLHMRRAQRMARNSGKEALDILSKRCAEGRITQEQFDRLKQDISNA